MSKILELREKRAKAWDAAKAFLDAKRTQEGFVSAEDAATYDKMEADVVNLGKEIERLERQAAIDAELAKATSTPITNQPKFNICNVHYAPITVAEEGTVSFGTPVPMPGAVSISMDPTGEPESFYADGIEYYVINNNQGYDGDLELAMIPESFRTDILKEEQDANKVLVENANSETGSFALLFEFDGDIRKIRHVLYNCSASRPTIESKTNEEDKEVQTETLTVKARPMADGYVKAKTGDSTTDTVYNNWYKSVYLPTATPALEQQSAKSTKSVS